MTSQLIVDLSGLLPLGEKKYVLNKFINHVQESEVNNILIDCQSLPSAQYDTLKLRLAERFRRSDLMIQLLYNAESVIVNEVVTKRWLYESDDSQLADCVFLINELFPNVSYNCRKKVLYRIGRYVRNVEKVDKIWNAVEEEYGLQALLQPLLHACSRGKINWVISAMMVYLSDFQLLQILRNDFDIGLKYLIDHYANGCVCMYSYLSSLEYIYENHPVEFIDLYIAYSNKMKIFKFGRGRSTKVIRSYRAKLLEHPHIFARDLKLDRIWKEFSEKEFQLLFESTLAPSPDRVDVSYMWKWVETVPVDKRKDLINSTYKKLFAINFDDHPEYMTPEYIMLLPNKRRLAVIQSKISEETYSYTYKDMCASFKNEEERTIAWIPFKSFSTALNGLRLPLQNEPRAEIRTSLCKYLIMTCYVHNSVSRLGSILIYINKNNLNDLGVEGRCEIFEAIYFIVKKFGSIIDEWEIIKNMTYYSLVKNEIDAKSAFHQERIFEIGLANLVRCRRPSYNLIAMAAIHILLKIKTNSTSWNTSYTGNIADERTMLELYLEELGNLKSNDNVLNCSKEFIISFLDKIIEFNKRQSLLSNRAEPIKIRLNKWLIEKLNHISMEMATYDNESKPSFKFLKKFQKVCQGLTLHGLFYKIPFRKEEVFCEILYKSPTEEILNHFLHNNPSQLIQNWSVILTEMLNIESSKKFMTRLKFSNYSKLVAESIKICTDILSLTIPTKQRCNAVVVLSILSEPNHFLDLAAKYYPPTHIKNISDQICEVSQTFAKSLLNVSVPHLALPAIEKFWFEDCRRHVLSSLNSLIYRVSQRKSIEFLQQHLDTHVNLRKHIIRLYFKTSSLDDCIRILQINSSTNVTIRNEIFKQARNLVRVFPCEITWSIFKSIIEKTTRDDVSIIVYLYSTPHVDCFPLEFHSEYAKTILMTLRILEIDKIDGCMDAFEEIINEVPETVLDDIILNIVWSQNYLNNNFCVKYLENSSSITILDHRLSNISLLLIKIIQNSWDSITTPQQYPEQRSYYRTRSLVLTFTSNLCINHMADSSKAWIKKKIFETLLRNFNSLSPTKLFKEILLLELGFLLVDVVEAIGKNKLRAFGRSLALFTDILVQRFGGEIMGILSETFKMFIYTHFQNELKQNQEVIVELVKAILEVSQSGHNQMIASLLMEPLNPECFKQINNQIRQPRIIFVEAYSQFISH